MAELASILDAATHWPVRHRRDQLVYDEGEPSTGMYRVERGCVRLQVTNSDGGRQIVAFLFPGDVFGIGMDRRTSSAEAVCDSELTRYSLPSVLELATRSSQVVFQLMRLADTHYGDLAHHLQQLAHLPAIERMLRFLNALPPFEAARPSGAVRLPMSRRDISDFLGLSPETVSRVLRQLQSDGRIAAHGHRAFVVRGLEPRLRPAPAPARPRPKAAPRIREYRSNPIAAAQGGNRAAT